MQVSQSKDVNVSVYTFHFLNDARLFEIINRTKYGTHVIRNDITLKRLNLYSSLLSYRVPHLF